MAADNYEAYYWAIYALIFESDDILAFAHPNFALSDVDTASIAQVIHAVLPFQDGSRLYAEIVLAEDGETIEDRYAYMYYDGCPASHPPSVGLRSRCVRYNQKRTTNRVIL